MWIYTKKAGSSCLSPVPHSEALALPTLSERATQKPRRYVYKPLKWKRKTMRCHHSGLHITYPQSIYRCFVFDKVETCEISECQEQSVLVNAFIIYMYSHHNLLSAAFAWKIRYKYSDLFRLPQMLYTFLHQTSFI